MVKSLLALPLLFATAAEAYYVEVAKTVLREGDHIWIEVKDIEAPADAYLLTEIDGTLYFVTPGPSLSIRPVPIKRGITSQSAVIFDFKITSNSLPPGRYPAYILLTRPGGIPTGFQTGSSPTGGSGPSSSTSRWISTATGTWTAGSTTTTTTTAGPTGT